MKDKQIEELSFEELKKSNNFQIIKEKILQVSDNICSFYDRAYIRDFITGKETYINENLIDVLFPMFEKYATTQMKREGVYNLANEKEQPIEDNTTIDVQLKEFINRIDYNNKEQVEILKELLKIKYPNIDKLWEM